MKRVALTAIVLSLGLLFLNQGERACVTPFPCLGAKSSVAQEVVEGPPVSEAQSHIVGAFGRTTASADAMMSRTASALQNVGKNLILENTRGTKDIEIYKKVASAVVCVYTQEALGSGAILDRDGQIITNWHVVKDYPDVTVLFKPKDSTELKRELAFAAKVVKVDQVADLALLKINTPPRNFSYVQLGDGSSLEVGQDVHAIGHPEGEVWTYTKGIISQIRPDYTWITEEGITHKATVIQSQSPINPGNSGGPLLDDKGRIVGINSFRKGGEGLNYAVAVDVIKDFLRRKEDRVAPAVNAFEEPQCPEGYDSQNRGWQNIMGCYLSPSSPPPQLWIVRQSPKEELTYMATDSNRDGNIDVVTYGETPEWKAAFHYADTDCDGYVDVIGYQKPASDDIDTYRRPTKSITIKSLAEELDMAIKKGKIPYTQLKVCQ